MGPLKNVLKKCNFFRRKKDVESGSASTSRSASARHHFLPFHGQEGSSRHSFAGMQAAFSRSFSVSNPVNIGEPSFHREGSSSLAPPRSSFAEGSSRNIHGGIPSQAKHKNYKSRDEQKRQDERDMRDLEKGELQAEEEEDQERLKLEQEQEKEDLWEQAQKEKPKDVYAQG